ncbi:MAG: quinol:cytochrome C oxidoreductase [Myxococcota bacterium]
MSAHDDGMPSHDEIHIGSRSGWRKLPAVFGVVGIACLGIGFATKGEHGADFFFSYLVALMFWLALGLGGLFFVVVQHATRAGWSIVVRRLAENAMMTLPVLGLLALPVVFLGAHDLYHWTHLEVVAEDPMLSAKQGYLNEGFFRIRSAVYIVIWTGLALMYWNWSTKQDNARDPIALTHKMRWAAPVSVMLFALSLTFGAFDFLMSLDPHWFSTIFGVYYFAGCVIFIHAFLALVTILLHRSGHLRGVVTPEHFHDLGKMMFAFTVFWTYVGFSQYMLIWYASIPEETHWFSYRGQGDFLALSIAMIFIRFVFPFLGLMSKKIKRNPKTLAFWCVWVMFAQAIDMFWLIKPAHSELEYQEAVKAAGGGVVDQASFFSIHIGLADVTTFLGIGGLVLAVFTWATCKNALIPTKDPRLLESINHENF